jgi:hypothetical protein
MKIAICFASERANAEHSAAAMAESMRLTGSQQCTTLPIGHGALACVTKSDVQSSVSFLRRGSQGNVLAIAGVPITLDGSLDTCLASAAAGGYEQAIEQLTHLDGAFVAVFWGAKARKLAVVTDPLGLQPLYIARPDEGLLIASELKAFPASGLMATEMDPAGWGAFFSFDFNIGCRTQLARVSRVKAATVLSYSPANGKLDAKCYWSFPEPCRDMGLEDVDIGQLLDVARREVKSYVTHSQTSSLLLSAGFDSRLIMLLLIEDGIHCAAVILEHQDELFGLDGRLAVRVAKKFNQADYQLMATRHRYYESPEFLRYLVMGEVAVPCLDLFIAQVSQHLRPEMAAVWEGLCFGSAFTPMYPDLATFEDFLRVRCRPTTSLHWEAARTVFSTAVGQEMEEGFARLLGEEIARFPNDQFGVTRFQMDNRKRRCSALNPMTVYANDVLPFIPGVSKKFWDIAGRIPRTLTANGKLYMKLYREHFPEALSVPFCSGGNIHSARAFTPMLWTMPIAQKSINYARYYWHRMGRLPIAGRLFARSSSGSNPCGVANRLVDCVVQSISLEHGDLNPDAVMAIRRMRPPYDWKTRIARHHLFYWQIWRWVMEGELTTWNAETFLQD